MKKQLGCVDVLVPPDIITEDTSSEVFVTEGANQGTTLLRLSTSNVSSNINSFSRVVVQSQGSPQAHCEMEEGGRTVVLRGEQIWGQAQGVHVERGALETEQSPETGHGRIPLHCVQWSPAHSQPKGLHKGQL